MVAFNDKEVDLRRILDKRKAHGKPYLLNVFPQHKIMKKYELPVEVIYKRIKGLK